MLKILLGYKSTDAHAAKIAAFLNESGQTFELVRASDSEVPGLLADCHVFCGHVKAPVDWEHVVEAGNLQWIQSSAAGLDHCLVPEVLQSEKIMVSSASGLFARQVSETALSLLLGLLRRHYLFYPAQHQKTFERMPTDDLAGKRIGLFGFGGNGQMIASQLLGFADTRVWATDFFVEQSEIFAQRTGCKIEAIYPPNELHKMLPQIDILIITVGKTASTFHAVGRSQLECLPDSSYLINVGRGDVVDQNALMDVLESNRLTAAGLDVVATEPPLDSDRIWKAPRLILTPHIGAQSNRRFDDVTDFFIQNLKRYLERKTLVNQVDKTLGFPLPGNLYNPFVEMAENFRDRPASPDESAI